MKHSGFTLIEITIALLILAVGLVGILTLFPVGFKAVVEACNLTTATFLAQAVIEDVKKVGYSGAAEIQAGKGIDYGSPYSKFEYDLTISDVAGLSLKQVDVEVFWPAGKTNQKSISLSTFIADYEP